jgi:hypothetical protein
MESDLLFRSHDIKRLIQTLSFKVIISIYLSLEIGSVKKIQEIHYIIFQSFLKIIYNNKNLLKSNKIFSQFYV